MPENEPVSTPSPEFDNAELGNYVQTVKQNRPKTSRTQTGGDAIYGDSAFFNWAVEADHLILADFEKRNDLENRIQAVRDAVLSFGPTADDMTLSVVNRAN